MSFFLLSFVAAMTASGLTYQLLTAALVASLAGDSVLVFSTIIGAYLFALGVGSYCSRFISEPFSTVLVQTGYGIGFLGGLSTSMLWLLFSEGSGFYLGAYFLILALGVLVGLQVPLIMRQLKAQLNFKELISGVLAIDYGAAVIVSLAFPLFLLPRLGLNYTALLFGFINVAASLGYVFLFDREGRWAFLKFEGLCLLSLLAIVSYATDSFQKVTEQSLFPDPIVFSQSTPYQRIVVTRSLKETRLYLNNNLQFSSLDEYRYHEALVIPPLRTVKNPRSVLILGGGDGLAAKILLQDPRVESVTLVDLDPAVTDLFRRNPSLRNLNDNALNSPKVKVVNADAFKWIEACEQQFDLILVDFPDPSSYSVAKLYTTYFYRHLSQHLNPDGAISVQSSSPLKSRRTFWCIAKTLESAGFQVRPYHAHVPSFGEWGFCLARQDSKTEFIASQVSTLFVDDLTLPGLFLLPQDMAKIEVEKNTLFDQVLVRYFRQDWSNSFF